MGRVGDRPRTPERHLVRAPREGGPSCS
jgi:hypothetical protein